MVKIIPFSKEVAALMKGTSVTSANPPGAVWFGCFLHGVLVGACSAVPSKTSVRIKSLVVLKEHRGHKFGRMLWDYRMDWILRGGYKKITGFASPYSQPMYLKAGFKLVRRIPRGERGETWFMELQL